MRALMCAHTAAFAVLVWASAVHADDEELEGYSGAGYGGGTLNESRPSTGTGFIVSGWILSGVGMTNLVTAPLCRTPLYTESFERSVSDLCLGMSLGLAAVGLGVGIPLLVVGYNKRSRYKQWKRSDEFMHRLTRVGVSARRDGVLLGYQVAF